MISISGNVHPAYSAARRLTINCGRPPLAIAGRAPALGIAGLHASAAPQTRGSPLASVLVVMISAIAQMATNAPTNRFVNTTINASFTAPRA